MKVLKNSEQVEALLVSKPHLKDDDNALVGCVWYIEARRILTPKQFEESFPLLALIAKGELTSAKTICRTRAKLQQEREDLRGEKYKRRHTEEEEEAREDLRAFERHQRRSQTSVGI